MGFGRKLLYTALVFGALGGVAGTQEGTVPKAYEKALKYNIEDTREEYNDAKNKDKKYFSVDKDYERYLADKEKNYFNAKKDFEKYENASDLKKKAIAWSDVKKYEDTFKKYYKGNVVPKGKDGWEDTKKGAATGAGVGAGLAIASAIRKRRRRNISNKFFVFLGLLCGGAGISIITSNFSGDITGNVIGSSSNPLSIIGIVLLFVGIAGTYLHFRKKE